MGSTPGCLDACPRLLGGFALPATQTFLMTAGSGELRELTMMKMPHRKATMLSHMTRSWRGKYFWLMY